MVPTLQQSNTVAFPPEKSVRARQRIIDANEHVSTRLNLSNMLQTTLDLTQVLQLFYQEVAGSLAVDSLHYKNEKTGNQVDLGKRNRHSCHYNLITQKDSLGEIVFSRGKRFSEEELEKLEMLLSTLICPIRNALMYQEAIRTALKDPLTGVGNRLALDATLEREIGLAKRHKSPLSVLVIDIDYFKSVNDRYGHTTGDCVLKDVARQLVDCCRDTDATYRYGGEEFVIILNNTNAKGAHVSAERIRQRIEAMSTTYDEQLISVTTSIGVAELLSSDNMGSLFERADQALYQAKDSGRNKTVISSANPVSEAFSA